MWYLFENDTSEIIYKTEIDDIENKRERRGKDKLGFTDTTIL